MKTAYTIELGITDADTDTNTHATHTHTHTHTHAHTNTNPNTNTNTNTNIIRIPMQHQYCSDADTNSFGPPQAGPRISLVLSLIHEHEYEI